MKLKDKKIQIVKLVNKDHRPIHPGKLWAYYRQLSGKEMEQAALFGAVETVEFIINWRADVREGMFVIFGNKRYTVSRIDNFEGYKKDLTLYCTSILPGFDVKEYKG
jgi:SPP1 family predicted phage head-tail adaptor